MSRTETIKCDGCGKTVIDGSNVGWIRFEATDDYSVDLVGEGDEFEILASDRIDFCSVACFCKWLKGKVRS